MFPDKIQIEPHYKKENGVWVLDLKAILLPRYFRVKNSSVVYFPPGKTAGNHRHQQTEIFIAIGKDMELHWVDKDGKTQVEKMNPKGKLMLYKVPPFLPHAVHNDSSDQFAVLIEFANGAADKTEAIKIVA